MFGVDPLVSFVVAPPTTGHARQAEMDHRFGVGTVAVEHRGVLDRNTLQLIPGCEAANPPWPQEFAADIIIVKPRHQ